MNTIEKLMERKDKFDYIFIELDGLADPGPVASTFWVRHLALSTKLTRSAR